MPDPDPKNRPYPAGVEAIFAIARRLRAPDGCPWDREQTHESLRPYLLEETYELLEVIDTAGSDEKMREELGDVLLQVAMHSAIAEEQGRFDAAEVSEAVAAKMVSRHPHVFGDTEVRGAAEVLRNWEQLKAAEAARQGRTDQTVLDRVPTNLPALAWTLNMQKRGARVGFDPARPDELVDEIARRAREVAEGPAAEASFDAVGELLMAVVSLARTHRVNAEDALRSAGQRYRAQFARMDRRIAAEGVLYRDLTPEEVRERWEAAAQAVPSPKTAVSDR